jgi:ketosteroid isomerase-like protein
MSANTDLLREFYAALEADDIDRAAERFAPDIEIHTRLESHVGADRCKTMLREAFSDFEAKLQVGEVSEPVPGKVVASYLLTLRGRHSEIESSQEVVDVAHFRDGQVYLVEVFSHRDDALASIGTPP